MLNAKPPGVQVLELTLNGDIKYLVMRTRDSKGGGGGAHINVLHKII
jgi:hypothetical protein